MPGQSKKILVVDDEFKIVEVLKSYLEKESYEVLTAYGAHEALEKAERCKPDLILLDLMLPDLPGEEVCRIIRKQSDVPIIMLTARAEEENILEGLRIGADDYVTKPFSPRQVLARVEAVLRRVFVSRRPTVLSYQEGDLKIDTETREVFKKGAEVSLTPNEFNILTTLAGHPRKAFTREELITLAMGEDYDGYDRTIDTHIKNLRQKIETDAKNPVYILTVHGIGYRFGGNSP